ncbi:tail sheath stabilizer [Campylobacter phage CPX]|uniref:Tail sheath stabilizer and completion protein n=2 Tax=Fletchervirus TaxID=1636618 RepID=G8GIX9_9CAUD|nr:tail sheath stabilizer [Campylobacter phage CPX]AET34364.1 tail sheath stabilizer and completion protein [Campylobacter phage CPX]AGS81237.1 tail sheath stabilizer and completion protein [Campylobacter phage CP8]
MEFFFFETTKKYCKGLLDIFNSIQVKKKVDEKTDKYVTVPISFGSKDAASVFSDTELDQLLNGNFNILPRMSLALMSMERDDQRATSRFQIPIKDIDGKNITFQHNCVPYSFDFVLSIATRSLTDLTSILEQILPFFNPNINLRVRELEWLTEPTTIQVELISVDYELPDENDGADIRVCSANVTMRLHGNIYPPIKNGAVIQQVKLYLSPVVDFSEDSKEIVHKFNIDENTHMMDIDSFVRIDYGEEWNKIKPVIDGVKGEVKNLPIQENIKYRILYTDDTDDNIKFIINVLEDNGVNPIISKQLNYFTVFAKNKGTLKLSIQAVNSFDLQSNIYEMELEFS